MLKLSGAPCIRLRGVRHNNLKNFDLDLPLKKLIVITGLSGSGKSSLAFDTLFAEGQRRYIETFSPYARQFLDRMDKPRVDSISGIPPAIAIEQKNSVRTTRSTVGTLTEICDHMKLLWPHIAKLHCRECGRIVSKDSPASVWEKVRGAMDGQEVLITFSVQLSEKLSLQDSLALIARQGYQRLLINRQVVRLEECPADRTPAEIVVIQDRLRVGGGVRPRFKEACEQAYHFGKGKLAIYPFAEGAIAGPARFSKGLHCANCDIEYREPSPALFNFNNPVGACQTCKGFGRVISIDYNLAVPDWSRTLRECVVKPWMTGLGAECQADMLRMCRQLEIPLDVPFAKLPKRWQDYIIEGEPGYGKDEEHEWPRAWYGVKGYFRWLESKAYKMHVRVLLSRYRTYSPCPACKGSRFQPEAMLYRMHVPESTGLLRPEGLALSDVYQLPIRDSLKIVEALSATPPRSAHDPLAIALPEVKSRLGFLSQVGLGYLTLDRPTRSLSGGETERVSLTTCLGTRLVNTLFVLDEPSVGLHPRDTERLVRVLKQLRDAGNTVVVVEHEASVMRAADQIVDLGPGHGATGGQVVFQGTYDEILRSKSSLTGRYLSIENGNTGSSAYPTFQPSALALNDALAAPAHLKRADSGIQLSPDLERLRHAQAPSLKDPVRSREANRGSGALKLSNVNRHNLVDFALDVPLGKLVVVTGLSGSGKTTLLREVLLPKLQQKLRHGGETKKASERFEETADTDDDLNSSDGRGALLEGWELLGRVVLVDQSILGKTPRSNPAVYVGAFDHIRDFFAASEIARRRGLNASAFSFNSGQGQCERCRGAGFEKIEMQFLSDVFIQCPDCNGKRYRPHILQVKIAPRNTRNGNDGATPKTGAVRSYSIADLLDATIEEAVEFLSTFPESMPARRAIQSLRWLVETGLGYLKLGQPINTLSGGESQRLKLVRHLADLEFPGSGEAPAEGQKPTLFLFDEPTTGLHFHDVRVLVGVLRGLVNAGHSVIVIEHNLDVMRSADWLIDLGPGAGDEGGRLVTEGTPEQVAEAGVGETAKALKGNGASREKVPAERRQGKARRGQ